MGDRIVTTRTGLLPIYTRGGANTIVYLSTTTNVGQLVTLRDMDGFLSTPQTITISTTGGATLTSPVTLRQGFGYVTLRSLTTTSWAVVDENPFPDPGADYDVRGAAYSSLTVSGLLNLQSSLLTTASGTTNTLLLTTLTTDGLLYVSTLQVATPTAANVFLSEGTGEITGSVAASSLMVSGGTSIATTLSTGGTLSIGGSVAFTGTVHVSSLSTGGTLSVSSLIVSGGATVGYGTLNSARMTRSLNASSLTTYSAVAPAVLTDRILSTAVVTASTINDPFYTGPTSPGVAQEIPLYVSRAIAQSMGATILAAPTVGATVAISSPAVSSVVFGVADIQAGTAVISSFTTGTLSTAIVAAGGGPIATLGTGSATVSTLTVQYACATGPLSVATLRTDTLTANELTASSINTGQVGIQGDSMTMSTIFISSGSISASLSSIQAPNATILTNGLLTSSLQTSSATASVLIPQVLRSATGSTLTFSNPIVFSTAITSSMTANTVNTSSLRATTIRLGTPLSYSTIGPNDPYTTVSTASGISTNTRYEYIQGLGTPYEPLQIHASLDRTVNITLANVSTQTSTCYFTANMTYRNDSSISGVAGLRIVNSGGTSTIISFNANPIVPFQHVTLSNYPIEQGLTTSTNRYYFAGVQTIQAPSTIAGPTPVWIAGGTGVSTLAYSADASTWSNISSGGVFNTSTTALAWSGTTWVAGGAQATAGNSLAYSYNGTQWFGSSNTVFSTRVNGVAYNGQLWVAAGEGTHTLGYSYDGVSWTGSGASVFTSQGYSVAWNGYIWVAVGGGTNSLAYSYTGTTWAGQGLFSGYGLCVAWGQGKWLAGGAGPSSFNLYSSTDGITWTGIGPILGASAIIADIAWNGSQWLAVAATQVAYSADGISWATATPTGTYTRLTSVTWTGAEWLVGATGTDKVLRSSDGASWSVALTGSTVVPTTVNAVRARRTLPFDVSGGDFVIATSDGATSFHYSLTGTSWTGVSPGIFTSVTGIAYGNGRWVAVGLGPTYTVAYSTDGLTWTGASSVFSTGRAVAWNGYMWVAVGDANPGNAIAYSYDGITWTGVTGTSIFALTFGIAWDHTKWYAYGPGNPSTTVATSPDGITWTAQSTTLANVINPAIDISNNIWVGGIFGTTPTMYRSTNGIAWTAVSSPPFDTGCHAVAFNGSMWVAVGGSGATSTSVAYSTNGGITWTAASSVFETGYGITWTGKVWIATGVPAGSGPTVAVSADGISWTPYATDLLSGTPRVASRTLLPYGFQPEHVGYALGQAATNDLAITTDGKAFRGLGLFYGGQAAYCIAWNGVLWVMGGGSPNPMKYSTDGINWSNGTITPSGVINVAYAVAWGNGRWVAGVNGGSGSYQFIHSTDGINWTAPASSIFSLEGQAIAYAAGLWILGGNGDGTGGAGLRYSLTGTSWTVVSYINNLLGSGRAVAYGNGRWVAVGGDREIATSTDGINWAGVIPGFYGFFGGGGQGIAYGNGVWVAVGVGFGANTIGYSLNGTTWTGLGKTIFTSRGTSVSYNGRYFFATGWGPTSCLAYSPDGINWTSLGSSVFTGGFNLGLGTATRRILPYRDAPAAPAPVSTEARTFTWSLTNMTALTQTEVQKTAGGTAWNARAASVEGVVANAYLSFRAYQTNADIMIGFSENPTSTTSFTTLDFAIFVRSNGTVNLVELGTTVLVASTYTTADVFRLIYDGTTVRYFQGSTLLRSVSRASGTPLYLSSSFNTPFSRLTAIDFHALYTLTAPQPALSAQGYSVSSNAGTDVEQFAPVYQTLTSNLGSGPWSLYVNLGGTPVGANTFWADICLDEVKTFSTTVISPVYTTPSTYVLSFTPTATTISTPVLLSVKWRATRPSGNTFLYAAWSNVSEQRSSVALQTTTFPNSIDYLQFFHTSFGSGLQTSELDLWVSQTSTPTLPSPAPSTGLELNRGYITWNSPLNGITIENRFNDTTTRSLTYTGAIYTASDSRAKTAIRAADQEALYQTLRDLPLYRYEWAPDYQAKFRPRDRRQLGVLATELREVLPLAVSVGHPPLAGMSSFLTVDRAQLRFAHLGATQALLARVSALKGRIASLQET